MVAWDFAVGADGSPIFLEGNTKVPGIFWIQFCTGPILVKELRKWLIIVKVIMIYILD